MKLTIDRAALLKALGHVQSVVERRTTIPILSNVKLEADSGELRLKATDMDLEVMDGVTAVRALRAREADLGLSPTPVAMLTANSLPEHIDACIAAGADLHLAKPITPASLLTAVAGMCDLSADQTSRPNPKARSAAG